MIDHDQISKIEILIHYAKIDEKDPWINRMMMLNSSDEAESMIRELLERQPIMGVDVTPHTLKEQKQAIEFAVAKDDFHEQRFKNK